MIAISAAEAADTASVTATVTLQNISLTVTSGTVAYGIIAAGQSAGTNSTSQTQTVTNNGNVSEDFNIKGINSTNWTLGATAGTDTYSHKFCSTSCANAPTGYTALTTSDQTLSAGIAPSGTKSLDLYLTVPTSSSYFTEQSVNVTVTAIAS
ncbi:MAG: hypothetical protein MUD10_01830 [Candidatus Pacebacteria bacterium]|nr:hypothetical protein [Candidatus Paceibacterota bacterium]